MEQPIATSKSKETESRYCERVTVHRPHASGDKPLRQMVVFHFSASSLIANQPLPFADFAQLLNAHFTVGCIQSYASKSNTKRMSKDHIISFTLMKHPGSIETSDKAD